MRGRLRKEKVTELSNIRTHVDFGGTKAEIIGVMHVEKGRRLYKIRWVDEIRGVMTATVAPSLIVFESPVEDLLDAVGAVNE